MRIENFLKKGLFTLFLLLIQLSFSNTKDSLSKLSFEDLRIRLIKSSEKEQLYRIYNDYYIKKAKKSNDLENLIKGYGYKVESYPFKEALKNADTMYYLAKNKFPKLLYIYYFKMGNLYCGNRKNKKALDYYMLAYKNCDKNNTNHYITIKEQVGVLRSMLGQYEEAIAILRETEEFSKKISPEHYLFQEYAIAATYNDLNQPDKAIIIINKGLLLSRQLNSKLMHDRFVMTKGVSYYRKKNYDKSLNLLLRTLNEAEFVKEDFSDYSFVSYFIAKCYEMKNEKEKALMYYKKVDSIFVKHSDIYTYNVDSYKYLINYFKKKGDLRKQLLYTERLIKADSVLISNNDYAFKKLNKEYDIPNLISEKESIIKLLKTKDRISKLLLFILFGIIGFGIFYFFKSKKIHEEKIKLLKNDLEKYLKIQHDKFEERNKIYTNDTSVTEILESTGKMSDEVKESILKSLEIFENENDFLKNSCSLEKLARDFNTNKTYLSKIINEDKGYSYSTYINNLRIEYTVDLLKKDTKVRKYSIESIAEEVGYNNVKAFSKAFQERIGIKPSVFIKNL